MAFTVTLQEESSQWVQPEERLWLTADREKIVAEDDPLAAFLFATPSDRISVEDAERYGLIRSGKASKPTPPPPPPPPRPLEPPAPKKRSTKKS